METPNEIKKTVKEKYAEIAVQSKGSGCCGPTSCCGDSPADVDYSIFQDDYTNEKGYEPDADLGLGCGIPTHYAGINEGDTVVDLGSGAGNDVFVARSIVGGNGKVIGLDMTEEMIDKANRNNDKLGFKNVEFVLGDIEKMPVESDLADVVLSNCVLNLVPDKSKAFSEIYRILKKGGHFCVSDIVIHGSMSEELRKSAELYAGCVSGAIDQEEYIDVIKEAGFTNVEIKTSKKIELPDDLLRKYLSPEAIHEYRNNLKGVFSITVVGFKN
ncbi:MAG: arsenite methyltransferase [Melioribacteraceae bacterium]|nr:arsenite methyltransferase [Melioribacteraceae bacterium]MCF8356141.1 arsenite methyltransferase [Melioribacteraceae bacterium]MCF8395489.1 arsenite methyltransferase [Melioribacteraceae bacterium]MCF8420829.1 arsenite methyltransferase [Melioribacteraceae bacterium]